eukprot:4164694-Amphidinium_carterae.1
MEILTHTYTHHTDACCQTQADTHRSCRMHVEVGELIKDAWMGTKERLEMGQSSWSAKDPWCGTVVVAVGKTRK